MRNEKCECEAVKPIGNGVWQCILGNCRRKFIPLDHCDHCERIEQKPVVVPMERVA